MKPIFKENTHLPALMFIFYVASIVMIGTYLWEQAMPCAESCLIIASLVLLGLFLASVRLTVLLNPTALQYRMRPFHWKKKQIPWDSIKTIKIKKVTALTDFGGWGVRYTRKYGWAYMTGSDYAIYIVKKNDKKLALAIKDKKAVADFLKMIDGS